MLQPVRLGRGWTRPGLGWGNGAQPSTPEGKSRCGGTNRFPRGTRDTRCPMHQDEDWDATCRGIKVLVLHISPKPHLLSAHPQHFRAHHVLPCIAVLSWGSQITERI